MAPSSHDQEPPGNSGRFRGQWTIEIVDGSGAGLRSSLALDDQGAPRVSYYDSANRLLKYGVKPAGRWVIQTIGPASDEYPRLKLDQDMAPHICYRDSSEGRLIYARGVRLQTISVTPADTSIQDGSRLQLEATGIFPSDASRVITSCVAWSSSDPEIASVTQTGLLAALRPGTAAIEATLDDLRGLAVLTIAPAQSLVATDARVHHAVSFPVSRDDNRITAVLAALGQPGPQSWRLGHWSPPDSAYLEAGRGLFSLSVAEGYWLITDKAVSVSVTGDALPPEEFSVTLLGGPGDRPAWNQVGNPFLIPIAVTDLLVTDGATTVALCDSINNELTEPIVKGNWNGSSYTNVSILAPSTSYWINKRATGPVSVIFPYNPMNSAASSPCSVVPGSSHWALRITARQGIATSEPLVLGSAPVPPGVWNPLDLSLAPTPPGADNLRLYLPKSDWGRMNGLYVQDFQPPAETMSWEFMASGAQVPDEITLEFTSDDLPPGYELLLSDPQTGLVHDVRGISVFTYAATEGSRPFRVTATLVRAEFGPTARTASGFLNAYPNPFLDRAGFRFVITNPGDLKVVIYDVAGRRVKTLERLDASPGEHVLVWDGLDETSGPLPQGLYLVRTTSQGASGAARLVKIRLEHGLKTVFVIA